MKTKLPAKPNSAHELSAYGAERNKPAGEMTCKAAEIKANLVVQVGMTAGVSLNSKSTESKCDEWAMRTAKKLSKPS